MSSHGINLATFQRLAKFCVQAYAYPDEHENRWGWVDAIDETLTDLARASGVEPKVTLRGVLEEMLAA